jgi:DNA gyrase subunit A
LHLLKGLERVLLDIDKAIEIIRKAAEDEVIEALSDEFDIDEIQANEVANMKLRHINRDHILKKIAEIEALEKKIAQFERIIKSKSALNQIIAKGLQESADKYGTDRKTQVIEMNEIGKITFDEEKTADYPVVIQTTKDGYVYKAKNTDKPFTLKAGDKLAKQFNTVNSAELLIFTEDGSCHKVKVNDIPETKAGAFGTYLPTIIEDTNIIGYSVLDNKQKFILNVFENRKVAKIDLQSFIGNRKKLKNSLNINSKLIDILTYDKEGLYHLYTNRFDIMLKTEEFTTTATRSAQGSYATTRKGEVTRVEKV